MPALPVRLHCCKQCVHFDTGKQFECTQPIPERIAKKDAKNNCTFFEFRMTVEKDTSPVTYATKAALPARAAAGRPNDARKAFEDLAGFKAAEVPQRFRDFEPSGSSLNQVS
jgi:hypothetical protein